MSQESAVPEVAPVTHEQAQAAWLAERNSFIGGSEVFELLNEKQYGRGCVRALAYRKLGVEPDYPEERDEALLQRGNILEPLVAAMYEQETGRKVRRTTMDEFGFPKVQRHPDYPWAGVHTDRFILAGSGGVETTGDLEIKTHGEGPFIGMMRRGLPAGHRLQVQWSNFVTSHKWGAFAILGVFGGLPLRHYDVTRDDEIVEIFKRAGERFATSVWGKGELPAHPFPADDLRCKVCSFRMTCRGEELDAAEAAKITAEKAGKTALVQIADPVLAQAVVDRELIKQELEAIKETLETVEGAIVERMGANQGALVGGYKVYCKDGAWSGLDQKKLKAEEPKIFEKYSVSGRPTGNKTIRVYPPKAS